MSDEPKQPTIEDVTKLTAAIKAERESTKAVRAELKELQAKLAEAQTLQSPDAAHVSQFIEAATTAGVAAKSAELVAKVTELETAHTLTVAESVKLKETLAATRIEMAVRELAHKSHVRDDRVTEMLLHAKIDGLTIDAEGQLVGKDGVNAEAWQWGHKALHPEWWPLSRGTGARGNNNPPPIGRNPFRQGSPDFNLTKQAEMLHMSPNLAAQMQAEAGSKLS